MKFCSNCGTQNDDNTAFCASCGKPFGPVAPAAPVAPMAAPKAKKPASESSNPFVAFKGAAFILLIVAIAIMGWGLISGIIEVVKGSSDYSGYTIKKTHDFYVTLNVWFEAAYKAAFIYALAAIVNIFSKKNK